MNALASPPRRSTVLRPEQPEPRPFRVTREEFYRLNELGFFQGRRAERIDGEIIIMAPQDFGHSYGTDSGHEFLKRELGPGFWVRSQLPLELGLESDPEPDISVVAGSRVDYRGHPQSALLVVEISDSTLRYDRTEKLRLYAEAGIPEYWIVNLIDRQVEVHRQPIASAEFTGGHGYRDTFTVKPGELLAPAFQSTAQVAVVEFFPPTEPLPSTN